MGGTVSRARPASLQGPTAVQDAIRRKEASGPTLQVGAHFAKEVYPVQIVATRANIKPIESIPRKGDIGASVAA